MQHAGEDSRREKARPEMKKRKASNFYTGLYVFMSFFFLGGTAFFSWILTKYVPNDPSRPYDFGFFCGVIFIIVGVVGFCASIYMVLKGAFSAAYMVDAEGMTTYWRKTHTGFCGPTASSLRSCRFRSTGVPRPRSYIAPRVSSPRKKKRISSGSTRTILRTCSISSTVMRQSFRSFALRSGAGAQLSGSESACAGPSGGVRPFPCGISGGFHKQRLRRGRFCGIIKPICA